MAVMRPFKAIRPNSNVADKVISLPYDVMNREEAAQMAQENKYSFLNICRSEICLPEEKDTYCMAVYEKAKSNIQKYLDEGIFIEEKTPVFYIYRQIMNGAVQTGIVGCASIDDYINNVIKKHELTRVEKELDRINHFDVCDANTEPVFLTYKENPDLRKIMEDIMNTEEPIFDIKTDDGVAHILWVVNDPTDTKNIQEIFGTIPSLYIADGHHRSASACKVGLKRREENPNYTGEEEFNFFMVVAFPDEDLEIFDYNRVVKDLNGLSKDEYLAEIEKAGFEVEKLGKEIYKPEVKHEFSMFLDGEWYRLVAKDEIIPNHVTDSLDVAILQANILDPILGVKDPRTDKRIDFVGGIRGLKELERRVAKDMEVGFALYPVSIADLINVSDNDMIMPPKSTWFEPKLGSGLFLHKLK